jgi:hypothetical protein
LSVLLVCFAGLLSFLPACVFCVSAAVHAGFFAGVTVGFWLLIRFAVAW